MTESNDYFERNNKTTIVNDDNVEWINFDAILGIVQRQWKVVAIAVVIALILGVAYLMSATPRYTSYTSILYEKARNTAVNELVQSSDVFGDQSEFSSQLQLVRSQRVLRKVAETLELNKNDAFLNEGGSPLGVLIQAIADLFMVDAWLPEEELSERDLAIRTSIAVGILSSNIEVERLGLTYIIVVSYTSEDRVLARKIASAIANAYLTDQLDAKYDSAKRTTEWLQSRIDELKAQSVQADLAVQNFKEQHNLVQTGAGANLAEAQLAGANEQLIKARGEVADAKAEFDKLNEAIESENMSVVVDAALSSGIISGLREKFLDLSKREAEFSARLGDQHAQVINLRNEMREYQRLMFDELRRLRDSAKSAYDIAVQRQVELEQNLNVSVGATEDINRVRIRLTELERESESYKQLLDNFLQKYQTSIQQQSLSVNDARVIREANTGWKTHPRTTITLAISILLGGVVGGGIAGVREFMERYFRTGDQVRDILGIEFIGLVPKVDPVNSWSNKKPTAEQMNPKAIRHAMGISNFSRLQSMSSFAETLRGVKIAANISLEGKKSKVIGMISTLPGEGKSTLASNLAQLLATQGAKTLLIDGDMRNPGLTRMIAPHAKSGLIETLMNEEPYDTAFMFDPEVPKLRFIPTVLNARISHTSDLLASVQMQKLLDTARAHFDYIIVDLPPVAPVVDVKAFAKKADGFVLVVEWGKTTRSLVKTVLNSNPIIKEKCLGTVLNKTEIDQMKYYANYGSPGQYYAKYSSYYRDDKIS